MGVNESQSKFSWRTCHISLIPAETPLFYLTQDRLAIDKLSAIGTGLGITPETQNGARKTTREINDKTQSEKQFMSSQSFHRTPAGGSTI
jgi:hypothetical protein